MVAGRIVSVSPNRGPFTGGTLVTITAATPICSGEADAVVVTLGGIAAKITHQDSLYIIVSTPEASRTCTNCDVVVTSATYGKAVASKIFTYQGGIAQTSV